eukprot:CAMPEP_0201910386 /NCGR_PEP_ID=MMETSP0903-20130614/1778_1 /ASSEMBLY_ACC=CAM_ASM_000552 /TAXON_ID=420261 /ORGANISM="Thalassiosira antarctica, Strain CCMP982" /LENGTH=386 /DNA_ID=CAMNT_0048445011 /DNA_START=241 /DNA_END=1401 /DNA_ORIENTATION=-
MATPTTLRFKFNNFNDTSIDRYESDLMCDVTTGEGKWKGPVGHGCVATDQYGKGWILDIFIEYSQHPNFDDHEVSIRLRCCGSKGSARVVESLGYTLKCHIKLLVQDGDGHFIEEELTLDNHNHARGGNFKRVLISNGGILEEDGSLIVEVIVSYQIEHSSFSLPESPVVKNLLKLLSSGEDADVFFHIDDDIIPAHKLILKMNAPFLASLFNNGKSVPIEGCSLEVFRVLLKYVYGDNKPDSDFLLEHNKDIIKTAHKYGIIGLKLEAEAARVQHFSMDASNVVEILLFADQMKCAIIMEYAKSVFVDRFDDIVHSESFDALSHSFDLLKELMIEVKEKAGSQKWKGETFERMSVNKLLDLCQSLDLDYDGTKEVLIARLEEYEE